ncbi:hypothetical protein ACFW04_007408 [Cataglyphis niger]
MDMNVDDAHMATVPESLISEAASKLASYARNCIKRPSDQVSFSSSMKNLRSNMEGSIDSHLSPVSGSSISLTDSVRSVICELHVEKILEIRRIEYSKVKKAANALVKDRLAIKEAFIPAFQDSFSSINHLPSLSVSLTFKGQKIPNHIFIFHQLPCVSIYSKKLTLYQCFRFRHIKTNCKNQPCCVHCGEKEHSKEQCQRVQSPLVPFFRINFALLKLTANFFSLHSHTSSPFFPLF